MQQDDLPKFSFIDAKDLTRAIDKLLSKLEQDFASLESKLTEEAKNNVVVDFEDVLPQVERIQFGLGYAWVLRDI